MAQLKESHHKKCFLQIFHHSPPRHLDDEKQNGILVEIDGTKITQQDYQYITQLAEILDNEHKGLEQELIHFSDDPEFELGSLKLTIKSLKTYEKELIVCKKY